MNDDEATAKPAGERHALVNKARVEITVSFPPLPMSVVDVEAMEHGQVIDLGVAADEPLRYVTMAGRSIGTGRLVIVGNNAGLLLTRESL